MIELTDKEREDARKILYSAGVNTSVEEGVEKALEAYVIGGITSSGKDLLKAAGYELIGNGVWSKIPSMMEKKQSTQVQHITVATEILVKAKEAGYYPNDPPTSDKELVEEAQEVVNFLLKQSEVSKDSEAIIDLAKNSHHGSVPDDLATVPFDDYDNLRITELKIRIETGVLDAFLDSIEAYEETLSKPRVRVLGYIKKRKEELEEEHESQGSEKEPTSEETGEREVEDTAPEQADAEGETGQAEGESYGSEATNGSGRVEKAILDFTGSGHIPDDDFKLSSEQEYQVIVIEAEAEVKNNTLHKPSEPDTKDLDLPFDLTQLSDKALQKAYGAYNALAYRVNYKLMLEEAKLRRVKLAVKELRTYLFSEAVKYDEQNHQRTNADITSEIEQNETLKHWIKRENVLDMNVEAYRSQRDGLYREVDMLSRLETMRHQEAERSGHR